MAGGGTAGHVFPALAVAELLRDGGDEVVFVGSEDGPEARLVEGAGYRFRRVRVLPAQTRVSVRSIKALWKAAAAARTVRPLIRTADVVVGIGGYASAPAILAARWSRVPIVLVEQNGVPGAVNRVAARWARVVATAFDAAAARLPDDVRVERTGNPVRPEILEVAEHRTTLRREALAMFELDASRRTVGVFGGSQGALHLNEAVLAALPHLNERSDVQLLIAAGPDHVDMVRADARADGELLIRVVGFIDRMDLALAVTDLAVSRSGAGHVTELAVCGVPAILVPYPHATENHQEANARELERAGESEVLLDRDLTGEALAGRIVRALADHDRLKRMSDAARAWSMPDAAARIASLIGEVTGE